MSEYSWVHNSEDLAYSVLDPDGDILFDVYSETEAEAAVTHLNRGN